VISGGVGAMGGFYYLSTRVGRTLLYNPRAIDSNQLTIPCVGCCLRQRREEEPCLVALFCESWWRWQ
jgi:hypothetical protein